MTAGELPNAIRIITWILWNAPNAMPFATNPANNKTPCMAILSVINLERIGQIIKRRIYLVLLMSPSTDHMAMIP